MGKYLKKRYKNYVSIALGLLIGFIGAAILFDKPDYKSGIFFILLGLIVGEIILFTKWFKEQKE